MIANFVFGFSPASRWIGILLAAGALLACERPDEPVASSPDSELNAPVPEIAIEQLRAVREVRADGLPGELSFVTGTADVSIPPEIAAFNSWIADFQNASAAKRLDMKETGRALLATRRTVMARLITDDPEAAIALALSASERGILPEDFLDDLESIIAGVGFYGVLAICSHGAGAEHSAVCEIRQEIVIEGEAFEASIYGARRDRLTEEEASLFGVALDGKVALHEDDVVILPDHTRPGEWLAIYRGETRSFKDQQALEAGVAEWR